jgi:hypothetical protein
MGEKKKCTYYRFVCAVGNIGMLAEASGMMEAALS